MSTFSGEFHLIAVFGLYKLVTNQIFYGTIEKYVIPPKPVVVSSKANDMTSSIFDYSGQIIISVRNDGGAGDIVFEATLIQGDERWTKTCNEYFKAHETKEMRLVFDEVQLLGGKAKYSYRVYGYSK